MDFIKIVGKKVVFSFFFIMILGCQNKKKIFESESIVYVSFVNEIIENYVEEVRSEFGFICDGCGGSMRGDVQDIAVSFVAYEEVEIDQARELMVKLIEKFRNCVNENKKIHPFLRQYPFPSSGAEIMLAFQNKKKDHVSENFVALVYQTRNKLHFRTYDLKTEKYVNLKEENYEDSLEIFRSDLKMKNQSL